MTTSITFPSIWKIFVGNLINNSLFIKDFELLIYNTPTEDVKVNVVLKDETIWATHKAMAALFGVQVAAISKHIKHVFDSGELNPFTTISKMETVIQRGFRGQISEEIDFY